MVTLLPNATINVRIRYGDSAHVIDSWWS